MKNSTAGQRSQEATKHRKRGYIVYDIWKVKAERKSSACALFERTPEGAAGPPASRQDTLKYVRGNIHLSLLPLLSKFHTRLLSVELAFLHSHAVRLTSLISITQDN